MVALLGSCEREEVDRGDVQAADRATEPEVEYLAGDWQGESEGYEGRDYEWEMHLSGSRRFSVTISGGKLASAERISGTWTGRPGGLTLFPENHGTEIFPFPARESESNGGQIGYHARITDLEDPGVKEFRFECCDFVGMDHRLIARRVAQ